MTKLAGELAGLRVERIINEPSAAAIAYHHATGSSGTYLVVDFGGGTLDISVVEIFENIVDIIAVAGDNHLGGSDIDMAVAEAFYAQHPKLKQSLQPTEQASVLRMAEQCKINLTTAEQAMMVFVHKDESYEMYLTNQLLLDMCAPIFAKMKAVLRHALKDSGRHVGEIDEIILVGGSGKMPVVRSFLEYITGKTPLCGIDPDKAIALGVGIVTGIRSREESIRDMIMTDICPFTLGTKVYNPFTKDSNEYSPIIERNSSLPVSQAQLYTTLKDGQTALELDIYQGESPSVLNNIWLGAVNITIPPAPAGDIDVLLRFTYDINGILEVDATCIQTGETRHKLILTNGSVPEQELEERRKQLQKLKISPRERDENRFLLEWGARLYEENAGLARELVQAETNLFAAVLVRGHPAEIEKARQRLVQFLEQHEDRDVGLLGGDDS
jgi:molecular chaperone HscC